MTPVDPRLYSNNYLKNLNFTPRPSGISPLSQAGMFWEKPTQPVYQIKPNPAKTYLSTGNTRAGHTSRSRSPRVHLKAAFQAQSIVSDTFSSN